MEQERLHPEATGELSNLLYDLCLAAKIISRQVRRAGLTDILGEFGAINVQGEVQQKLDVFANETVRHSVEHTGRVCVVASEEDEQPIPVQVREDRRGGKYVLLYDPLDGSTNIGVNVSIGTIFSIHRRTSTKKGPGSLADCLQKGRAQVAAGYILYGSSTMLVYTTGQGVHGFTLDPTIGEFLLSHRIPTSARPMSARTTASTKVTGTSGRRGFSGSSARSRMATAGRSRRRTRATSARSSPISTAT